MDKSQLEALLGKIDVWLLVFGAVVVIGVAGESFFGIRHWWNSRKLQAIQASEEQEREETIARLNREAADLHKQVEDERTARFEAEDIAIRAKGLNEPCIPAHRKPHRKPIRIPCSIKRQAYGPCNSAG